MNFIKHINNWYWGISVVIISEDCHGIVKVTFEDDEALIINLSVNEEYRNKGYGTALIDECIKEAKSRGFDTIYLYAEKNTDAYNLYLKLGFKVNEILLTLDDKAKEAGVQLIKMIKKI